MKGLRNPTTIHYFTVLVLVRESQVETRTSSSEAKWHKLLSSSELAGEGQLETLTKTAVEQNLFHSLGFAKWWSSWNPYRFIQQWHKLLSSSALTSEGQLETQTSTSGAIEHKLLYSSALGRRGSSWNPPQFIRGWRDSTISQSRLYISNHNFSWYCFPLPP